MSDDLHPTVVPMPERNEVQAAGEKLRREMDAAIDNAVAVARYRRAVYLAYLDAGFNSAQALELCCK